MSWALPSLGCERTRYQICMTHPMAHCHWGQQEARACTGPTQPLPSVGPPLGLAHSRCSIDICFPERISSVKHQTTASPSMPCLLSIKGYTSAGPGMNPGTWVGGQSGGGAGERVYVPLHTQNSQGRAALGNLHELFRCPQQRKEEKTAFFSRCLSYS